MWLLLSSLDLHFTNKFKVLGSDCQDILQKNNSMINDAIPATIPTSIEINFIVLLQLCPSLKIVFPPQLPPSAATPLSIVKECRHCCHHFVKIVSNSSHPSIIVKKTWTNIVSYPLNCVFDSDCH